MRFAGAADSRPPRARSVLCCLARPPPLARVGLSEAEAHRRGIGVRVAKLPMRAVLRTWTISESRGFMKARLSEIVHVRDRKSTRLNSSHGYISYAVFCLKKKK